MEPAASAVTLAVAVAASESTSVASSAYLTFDMMVALSPTPTATPGFGICIRKIRSSPAMDATGDNMSSALWRCRMARRVSSCHRRVWGALSCRHAHYFWCTGWVTRRRLSKPSPDFYCRAKIYVLIGRQTSRAHRCWHRARVGLFTNYEARGCCLLTTKKYKYEASIVIINIPFLIIYDSKDSVTSVW